MGSSPAKAHKPGHGGEIKEVKGTSIFGKSPKEFAKSVGEHALKPWKSYAIKNLKRLKESGILPSKGNKIEVRKKVSKDSMKQATREGTTERPNPVRGKLKVGKKLLKEKKSPIMPKGYSPEQSKKDRLDYQSGGTGLGQ